ncbi:HNH endonuclease family protein [Galbitalea sp. SE-J8]|uniref:HNH endonuclease family protein n=1 Tax=Galbitalea sp. SE-J8 TaxID=3054952 RepID=UPI0033906B91
MKRLSLWLAVVVVLVAAIAGAVSGVAGSSGVPGGAVPGGAVPSAAASSNSVPGAAAPGDAATPGPDSTSAAAPGTASALLATLPVKGRAPKSGYDRVGDFGTAWLDVDHNGCDTRNDILARDLTAIDRPNGCRVLSGTLVSPYTGEAIAFVRGDTTSRAVQIDHLVSLSDAWQTGAQQLTRDAREALANDPLNLLAVDGSSNSSKGDGDAATWLPPARGIRCAYVARQVAVKAKYALWVTPAEHDAIARILDGCPGQPVPVG